MMPEAGEQKYRRYIRWWFWSGAGLVTLMLIIGGITRLTGSGLSMTDWKLLLGAVPPLTESAWQDVFARYQQFPEYQQLNTGMTLAEFKGIYFWEYLHRLVGRLTGLAFALPLLWFWLRGYLSGRLMRRVFVLLLLGAAQGAMGWIMVKSGLVDVPRVSHYRLAAHLLFAFALAGLCTWYALDMKPQPTRAPVPVRLRPWMTLTGLVLMLQVLWGAFVAGLDAGYVYNTFPLMNGEWMPRNAWALQPALLNLIQNDGTVQWMHRLLGTALLAAAAMSWVRSLDAAAPLRRRVHLLTGLLLLQYVLGAATLVLQVPVALGVLHQALAMAVWMSWLAAMHRMKRPEGSSKPEFRPFATAEYYT